jgi:glycine/D-amino acid oxidase-like deaminating enzyme
MDVRDLPKDPGTTGWNAILPPEPARPELEGSHSADWLVIGAGFAGLAAARRLKERRPGDTIAVVDATRVGYGPAGRNSGFMIDLPHDLQSEDYGGSVEADRRRTAMNRAAIEFAAGAARDDGLTRRPSRGRGRSTRRRPTRGCSTTRPTRGISPRWASRTRCWTRRR